VKTALTGDVFEGVAPGPIPYFPKSSPGNLAVNRFSQERRGRLSLELGGPWAFYREFWRAHNIEYLADLVAPEVGVGVGQTLNVPLLIANGTDQPKMIRMATELPEGWSEQARFAEYRVAAHETYPVQLVLTAPTGHANEWHKITWKIETDGKPAASVELRVHLKSGGLPQ